jgi:hypothetical protein
MSSQGGIVGAITKGHYAVWFGDYIRRNNDCAIRGLKLGINT